MLPVNIVVKNSLPISSSIQSLFFQTLKSFIIAILQLNKSIEGALIAK